MKYLIGFGILTLMIGCAAIPSSPCENVEYKRDGNRIIFVCND